jgi:hypothetical protein
LFTALPLCDENRQRWNALIQTRTPACTYLAIAVSIILKMSPFFGQTGWKLSGVNASQFLSVIDEDPVR